MRLYTKRNNMSDNAPLFKNTFRIPSARWQGWDYGWNGWYFVTICTKDRACYFGDVVKKEMMLSDIGKIAQEEWLKTPIIRDGMRLDEWLIMPNHVHMVIEIINRDDTVETHSYASLQQPDPKQTPEQEKPNIFGPQRRNLAAIIRGFKGAVTARVTTEYGLGFFAWQPRYYDHIIRDEFELNRIRKYIRDNPANWEDDELHVG